MLDIISEVFTLQNILMMNIGIFAGIIIGAMPGLSVAFAVTVLLTMTIGMDSLPGMYMLLGGYCGATFGAASPPFSSIPPAPPLRLPQLLTATQWQKKGAPVTL